MPLTPKGQGNCLQGPLEDLVLPFLSCWASSERAGETSQETCSDNYSDGHASVFNLDTVQFILCALSHLILTTIIISCPPPLFSQRFRNF